MPPASESTGIDTAHKFEAYLIQNALEQMLPRDTDAAFGSGFSGEVWRSMLAERLANAVASRGGFGLALELSQKR
jgi:Rod binding domain-containing protein